MTTLRTAATEITIAELGVRYNDAADRDRDGVRIVYRGIDPGADSIIAPDERTPSGLVFGQAAFQLSYNGETVRTIEQGYRPDLPDRSGFWILTDEDAYVAEMDTPLMIAGGC
jgi:hypothetical protein